LRFDQGAEIEKRRPFHPGAFRLSPLDVLEDCVDFLLA